MPSLLIAIDNILNHALNNKMRAFDENRLNRALITKRLKYASKNQLLELCVSQTQHENQRKQRLF